MKLPGPAASFTLLACVFHADKLLGPYGVVRLHDSFNSELTRYSAGAALLWQNGPYAWMPTVAGGMPSYAAQASPFYPLTVLSLVAPLWLIYSVMTIALMAIAGYGMFRFLREPLEVPDRIAWGGGVFFALSTQIQEESIIHMVFNYTFPLFYVWTMGGRDGTRSSRRTAAVVGVVAMAVLSYFTATLPFFSVLQAALILTLIPRRDGLLLRLLASSVLFWIGYALLFAPQIYALGHFRSFASRVYAPSDVVFLTEFTDVLFAFGTLSLTLPLLGGSLVLLARSRRVAVLMALVCAFAAVGAFFESSASNFLVGTFIYQADLGHYLWTLNILMTATACVGVAELGRHPSLRKAFWTVAALVTAAALIPLATRLQTVLPLSVLVIAGIGVAFGWFAVTVPPRWRVSRVVPVATCAALLFVGLVGVRAYRLVVLENNPHRYHFGLTEELRQTLAGPEPRRVGTLMVPPAVAWGAGLETVDARAPVIYGPFRNFLGAAVDAQFDTDAERQHFYSYWYDHYLLNGGAAVEVWQSNEASLRLNVPLLMTANMGALISRTPLPELAQWTQRTTTVAPEPDRLARMLPAPVSRYLEPLPLHVYFLKDVFPRGYVVERAVGFGSDRQVFDALGRRTDELTHALFYSRADQFGPGVWTGESGSSRTSVTTAEYGPDRIVFDVDAPAGSFLVVTNNFDPHWTARVDGKETPLYRVNGAFQALRFDTGGRKEVVVEYSDPSLWAWHGASLAGLGLMLIALRRPSHVARFQGSEGDPSFDRHVLAAR